MSTLKFKLKAPKPVQKPPPKQPSESAFKDSEDEEDEEDSIFTKSSNKQPAILANLNEDLRTYTSLSEETSARLAKEALETDPSSTSLLFPNLI